MIALKRVSPMYREKARTCLRCGRQIEQHLFDNVEYTCKCGQRHFVDIKNNTLILTAAEHPEMRKRPWKEPQFVPEDSVDIQKLRTELSQALKEAKEWEDAAEGLARQIEEMHERK